MASTDQEAILQSLNKAQRRAVTSNAATVAILAGPGSGKTHTLTSRVVWLIQQCRIPPSDIIVATFTVKAAREMKDRIGKRLGEEFQKQIVLGTFHSIARRYLASYGKRIGLNTKFGIADDGDSRAIIQRICKRLNLQIEPSHAKSWISKRKSKGSLAVAVPPKKNAPPENPALHTCFQEYQDHLERANLLDYDDLLVKCVELLREHPGCVSNVQAVLVDEYQDTNGIQYDLMKLFAQQRQRITIVGDPDQSIYGWRSAEIKNLYRLLRDFPETDEISLEENYRSSQYILDVSLHVIQQDKSRYKKVLLPVHSKCTKPVLRKLRNSAAEGEWIVSELRRTTTMFGGALKNEDIAILLRSASLSRHIESALGKAGVPYRMVGGHKFYERKEIKILLDYLRVVYQPDNNDAIARIINVPRRGIGETTIKSLLEEAEQSKLTLWALLWGHCRGGRRAKTKLRQNMEQKISNDFLRIISNLRATAQNIGTDGRTTLVELIESLVNQLSFRKYLESEYAEEHEQRWANVEELFTLAGDFMRDFGNTDEDALPEIESVEQVKEDDVLGRFLANVALASDAQTDDKELDKTSLVTISTIHAAKGLEWPVVFVPSVFEGSIPHSRSEDMDEERRLLYVAMTRAKALLYVSCPLYGSNGFSSRVELSPFLSPFTASFASKGPSFDRPVVEGVCKILNRAIPTEKSIFDKISPMFCIEDDQFPVEPFDPNDPDGLDEYDDSYGRSYKRQKTMRYEKNSLSFPTFPKEQTTLESASEFAASNMPGFVTANAHQSAMEAASEPAAVVVKVAPKPKPTLFKGTSRRPFDQRSLLGFVTVETKSPAEKLGTAAAARPPLTAQPSNLVPHLNVQEAPKPALDPELARHKIPNIKAPLRHAVMKTQGDTGSKQYPAFSSSPPRAASASPERTRAPEQPPISTMQRAATSFHATTFTAVRRGPNGVRRPVGLGPPPSLDRLRKPFKPLTIQRPAGPPDN